MKRYAFLLAMGMDQSPQGLRVSEVKMWYCTFAFDLELQRKEAPCETLRLASDFCDPTLNVALGAQQE